MPPALPKPSRARVASGRLRGRRIPKTAPLATFAATNSTQIPPAMAAGSVASGTRVQEIITLALGFRLISDALIRMGDAYYYLPTRDEVTQVLAGSSLDRRTWLAQRFDCDDFSYVLKGEFSAHSYDAGEINFGFSVGIIWGNFSWVAGFHAVNLVVLSDETVMLIEPQSDALYSVTECTGEVNLIVV